MSTRGSTLDPIYPVELKPRSSISTWDMWPFDVRPLLELWNRGTLDRPYKLSFYGTRVFKCPDCSLFCEPAHNAAHLNGAFYCDDCLIVKARAFLAAAVSTEEDQ